LVHLADARGPQALQPFQQRVEPARLSADVDVQPVLYGLVLRYVLEEQSPAPADTGGLVVRVVGMADRREAAEDFPAPVLGDRILAESRG
jgi:hypothetical protein